MAELPESIGKYPIEALLARGGMGAVFKAMHPTLKRRVVLKKLTIKGSASIVERFKREARILMDFKHDNIVRVFDHFKEGSSHYMVMEYVDGMSLDALIKRQRSLSTELSLSIFLRACRALAYAHDMGVVHRDIKPANILISKKGEVKLADFGIASSDEDEDSGLTKEGMTLGTPSYMPPEQIENSRNVDKRADIYAMGIMLYEMTTGKKPFPGNFCPETVNLIQKGRYRRPRAVNRTLKPIIDRLVGKLVRPDPRRRYQDMGDVIRVVERHLRRYSADELDKALVGLMSGTLQDEPRYRPRRKKRFVVVPVAAALIAGAAGAWYAYDEGYLYHWFIPDRYGELRTGLRIPKAGIAPDDLSVRARLFLDDGDAMPELTDARVELRRVPGDASDPYLSYEADPEFLKPGLYRIKVVAGGRVLWESFRVPSIAEAGEDGATELRLRLEEEPARPLSVRTSARDAVDGSDLSGRASVTVLRYGSWVALSELPPEALSTGAVHKFRISAEGYRPATFSLLIGNGQDELRLNAGLVPVSFEPPSKE
ncbi:MAG: serine/threonine protein kinase [Spirochaetae bacterium HGW-Spirochaetae-3]|jgi:serine/threonine-protein kinase|nr:MAG: serine/threonine protein kinase [Spirochaetae bacterium HGW-Spirochaetae-3]